MSLPDMVKLASDTNPEIMEKIALTIQLIEATDPSFVQDVMDDFEVISDVVTEKVAAESGALATNIKQYLGALGTAAAGAVGISVAGDLYDAAKRGLTKARNYKRIVEHNPELKNQDPKNLRAAYDALHRYAPEFTADPMVGGAILRNLAEFPYQSQKTIYDVLNARKDLAESRAKQYNVGAGSFALGGRRNKGKSGD